jgi:phage-related protein
MLDSIRAAIEAKFQALAGDGRAFVDKVEEIVGLGNAAKELAALETSLTGIIGAADSTVEQKVEAILHAVGKL